MSQHTPGPWKTIPSPHGREYRCVQIGKDEAYTTLELEPADAYLIAAAPELLMALAEASGMLQASIDILKGARRRADAVERMEVQHAKCLALMVKATKVAP